MLVHRIFRTKNHDLMLALDVITRQSASSPFRFTHQFIGRFLLVKVSRVFDSSNAGCQICFRDHYKADRTLVGRSSLHQ